ncbi:uncharacterized protein LOC142176006 [Nicotiana tabacum]|uniref:Uncharacterized protein LOC142176006 n=1 Tax=Nicotiana tabacum TaxID=4097 RepID=A0AC58TPK1_TOBAC
MTLFLKKYRIEVMGIVETIVKVNKARRITQKMAKDWQAKYNYDHAYNGHIWLLCKPHIKLQILEVNAQFIYCEMEDSNCQIRLFLIVIYARIEIIKPKQVEDQFLSFFKKLMRESSRILPCPNSEEVTTEEIFDVVKSMPTNKAPNVDGFPIESFTQHWEEVKGDVLANVLVFFQTRKINKAINCTAITLIPKVRNLTQVKDYRPIA